MMQKAYDLGFKYEQDYRGCAQCAVAAIQDTLGLKNDWVYKAASGLAGGAGECIDGHMRRILGRYYGDEHTVRQNTKGRGDHIRQKRKV